MTVAVWDTKNARASGRDGNLRQVVATGRNETSGRSLRGQTLLKKCVAHTEFVAGVAFSLFEPGLLATCAWDRVLCLWR